MHKNTASTSDIENIVGDGILYVLLSNRFSPSLSDIDRLGGILILISHQHK